MTSMKSDKSIGIWITTVTAIVFGLLTIKSGGSVLFFDGIARENAGNYIPFVVWFNFLAGFAYLLAGAGIFMQKHWAVWISIFIVVATIVVFALLGFHILNGELYQARTVGAMILRTVVWALIAMFAYRKFITRGK
ncbi:MAG: hypothetical protein KAJ62_05070 [Desulfobacteraceae bacterium]|nr:hypothetical protein [Desulfobacteraceae bacterium]